MQNSLVGRKLNHYQVERYIASGGMADVYEAVDLRTDDRVAVKVLPPAYSRNHEMVERFHHEAKASGDLHHPNIVRTFEEGAADDLHYIAMELVTGRSLKDELAEHGALLPPRVLKIATQICHALNYAHARGVVHRDIKPANIMVDDDDNIIIMDFGIAKAADSTQLTSTGTAMGTPEYMSPEQIQGQADFRTDIYSLGVVMYEMLTGSAPFKAETPVAVAYKQTHEEPVPPSRIAPHVPRELERIVTRALRKSPDDRYPSAQAMYNDLPKEVRLSTPLRRTPTGQNRVKAAIPAPAQNVQSPVKLITSLVLVTLVGLAVAAYFLLLTGHLSVQSNPSGATVWINGNQAGETPMTKRMLAGMYDIRIGKGGYGFFDQEAVQIERQKQQAVSGELPSLIRSTPSAADVLIDGKQVGQTPLPYHFSPGQHTVTLKKEGYRELTKTFRVSAGNMAPMPEMNLAKIPDVHPIKITSAPSGAQTAIDGRPRGKTPLNVDLVAGQHHIYLAHPGYQAAEALVHVPGDANYHGTLTRLQAYGQLSVNAAPFGVVHVDGKLKGETPIVVKRISAGEHEVRLERTGFQPIQRRVVVEPDRMTRVGVLSNEWVRNDE